MGGLVCVIGGAGFLGVLMCGALALRAAVAVANRFARPAEPKRPAFDPLEEEQWEAWYEEERPRRAAKKAIPEPGVGKGMMITSTVGVLTALFVVMLAGALRVALDDVFDGDDGWLAVALAVLAAPLSFVGAALLLTAMLPTTLARAALVSFLYHVIGLVVLVTVGGAIAFVLAA